MLVDGTNLFISGINVVNDLFSDINWFKANKLSLNLNTKTKYSLFRLVSKKHFLKEPLPFLKMDNIALKEEILLNFLVYLLMKTSHGNST